MYAFSKSSQVNIMIHILYSQRIKRYQTQIKYRSSLSIGHKKTDLDWIKIEARHREMFSLPPIDLEGPVMASMAHVFLFYAGNNFHGFGAMLLQRKFMADDRLPSNVEGRAGRHKFSYMV